MIFTDDLTKSVIVAIKGTSSTRGWVADMMAVEVEFLYGFAHQGILDAALEVIHHSDEILKRAFKDYPDYQLVITGHSLGGGAAILAAMTFLSGKTSLDPKKIKIKVGSKMTS